MNTQQEYDSLEESMSIIDPAIPFSNPANGRNVNTSNLFLNTPTPISNPYSKSRTIGNGKVANPYASIRKKTMCQRHFLCVATPRIQFQKKTALENEF